MSWYTEVACTNVAEFIEAIDETRSSYGTELMVYRGLGDSDFDLRPTLYRERFGDITFELNIVLDFMLISQRAGLIIPPDAMSFIALYNRNTRSKLTTLLHEFVEHRNTYEYDVGNIAFAMARHAEIPTRHLDCSWDPLVATYFAGASAHEAYFDENKETPKDIAVWALHYPSLRMNFGVIHHDWTHIPSLRNQQGLFIFDPTIDVESLKCWTEAPSFEEPLSKIPFKNMNKKITLTFTPANINELARYVTLRNICDWTMFPTNQNVRNAVMDRYERRDPAT